MKNPVIILVVSGIIAASLAGCVKNGNNAPGSAKPTLYLSQSKIDRGQQLNASVLNASASTIVKWSVYPSNGAKVFSASQQATAYFGNAGSYRVIASYYSDSSSRPFDSSSSPLIVSDSIYAPPMPVQADTSALAGDAIQIEPVTATDTGGLIMVVQTKDLYDCNPYLNYYFSITGNTIELDCLSVTSFGTNCGHETTARGFIVAPAPANGTYTFNVILNTAVYQGTLTVTDGNYTFGWPYTSAVTISPLQIPKQ